jgi:hypothetical protein
MKQQVNVMTLNDQSWVLVTGASSGFGEEFARQYAAQGRALVLVARRIEKLQTLATELRERYRVDVIVEQVDLRTLQPSSNCISGFASEALRSTS